MRIIAFGDIHIGSGEQNDTEVMKAIEYIIEDIPSCDLIVITGDFYDRLSDPGMREKAVTILRSLASLSPVTIVRGNHDRIGDLTILSKIKSSNSIQVYEHPEWTSYEDAAVMFVPWTSKAEWMALNGVNEGIESADNALSAIFLSWLQSKTAAIRAKGVKNIFLFSHLTIAGARVSEHQEIMGGGIMVGTENLKDAGITGGVFGHIHMPQVFGDGSLVYTGSLTNLNFGETDKCKSYAIVDTVTGTVKLRDILNRPGFAGE